MRLFPKFTALATLAALLGLNGAGVVLAYAEQALAPGERCSRSCCSLGQTGTEYASACCQLRCQENVPERGSERAREPVSLEKPSLHGVACKSLPSSLSATTLGWPLLEGASPRLCSGQPDLYVKHSVFLV